MLKVNQEACVGCGVCARVCPTGAISVQNGKAQINQAACTNCYRCAQACPRGAIVAVPVGMGAPGAELSIQDLKDRLLRLQAELHTTEQRLQNLGQRRSTRRTRHWWRS